jgi:hypothetical protein
MDDRSNQMVARRWHFSEPVVSMTVSQSGVPLFDILAEFFLFHMWSMIDPTSCIYYSLFISQTNPHTHIYIHTPHTTSHLITIAQYYESYDDGAALLSDFIFLNSVFVHISQATPTHPPHHLPANYNCYCIHPSSQLISITNHTKDEVSISINLENFFWIFRGRNDYYLVIIWRDSAGNTTIVQL